MNNLYKNRSPLSNKSGFTLMEIILVFALISLLVGAVVGKFGGVLTGGEIKATTFKVQEAFKTSLFRYRIDMGSFPTTEQGLKALLTKPSNGRGRWQGPYIEDEDDLLDAWGNSLKYRYPSTNNPGSYDISSLGPDGKESDDDIRNWK